MPVAEGVAEAMKKRKLKVKISYESNRLAEGYLVDAYEKLIPITTYSTHFAKKIFKPKLILKRRKIAQ